MPRPDLVVVATFQNRIEAELAQGALQAAGIESAISADDIGGQYAGVLRGGIRLLVRAEDKRNARQVLDQPEGPKI